MQKKQINKEVNMLSNVEVRSIIIPGPLFQDHKKKPTN